MAVWDLPAQLWGIGRKIDELFRLQASTDTAFQNIDRRLAALENRMTHLEADRSQLVTEARAAAGMAATGMASSIISDVVTRVTRLEERQSDATRRLPPG